MQSPVYSTYTHCLQSSTSLLKSEPIKVWPFFPLFVTEVESINVGTAYAKMQPMPNRMGLGLRPPLPSYGQGPSISALAQQQQMHFVPPNQKFTTLFVGSISGGIQDSFLNQLLSVRVCIFLRQPALLTSLW